jgi:hypothetical protein
MIRSKARDYSSTTIKRLYTFSGNQCAFPDCSVTFVSPENETNISNICHIEAAEQGGERYNSNSTDDNRRSYENLILLCPNHHKVTDNVGKYTVEILRKMKKDHEDKIRKLLSEKNVLATHTSALNFVVSIIGKSLFETTQTTEPQNAPNADDKISYNNVMRYKPIIQVYSAYQGKLNKIYEEIEIMGSFKKDNVLRNINMLYLKEKGKYQTIDKIKENADEMIDSIKNELWERVNNSSNTVDLDYEVIEMSILVILVDAFMRCNILEEPQK